MDALVERGVPLHRNFQAHLLFGSGSVDRDHRRVDGLLVPDQILHIVDQAVGVLEGLLTLSADLGVLVVWVNVGGATVGDGDFQTLVQERHLAKAGDQGVVGIARGLKNRRAGIEGNGGSGVVHLLQLLQGVDRVTQGEGLAPVVAVAVHINNQ